VERNQRQSAYFPAKGFGNGVKVEAPQFRGASPRELYDRSVYFRPAWQEHWAKQQVHDFEREPSGLMIEEAQHGSRTKLI